VSLKETHNKVVIWADSTPPCSWPLEASWLKTQPACVSHSITACPVI